VSQNAPFGSEGVILIRSILSVLLGSAALLAAPSASACTPVSIYFGWNSAAIEPESRAVLEELAVALAWKGPDLDHVLLTSHTDSSGSAAANRALARRRADAVRGVLLRHHVPDRLIRMRAIGEDRLPVGTPANVREPANRRVDLLLQLSAEAQAIKLEEGQPIC